ncbi:MAG: nucleotide-binding protein [Thermoguttaceae bacterium]
MKIAVASGKGGTGKTTVATNLARVAAAGARAVAYLDCDVEEPNGHLFLKPTIDRRRSIDKPLPIVDLRRCTFCGRCSQVCRYGAIACVNKQVLIFTELCHSCGGCLLACPMDAIREVPKTIGELRQGIAGPIRFIEGRLNIGEAMSPRAIRAVKDAGPSVELSILDCPPGTSCPVIESVRGSDLVLLVTEPTPFGLHDLKLAVEMVRVLRLPLAVVLNRCHVGKPDEKRGQSPFVQSTLRANPAKGDCPLFSDQVRQYCISQDIAILAEITDDRSVAEAYSRGQLACDVVPLFAGQIRLLLERLSNGATR